MSRLSIKKLYCPGKKSDMTFKIDFLPSSAAVSRLAAVVPVYRNANGSFRSANNDRMIWLCL